MNFGDFTDGGNPGASDYIAGYRDGGGSGSDRRWLRSQFSLPPTDDGLALGSTSLKWSDGFFASGAVLNFNSGNVTLTHSTGALSLAGSIANPLATGLLNIAGTDTDPTLTHTSGAHLALNGTSISSALVFGMSATSPYPPWIQSRSWSGDNAGSLFLQPAGGGLAIGTTIAGLATGLSEGVQIGINWTDTTDYNGGGAGPGGAFALYSINCYGNGTDRGGIANFVRTQGITGAGLGISSYAFGDNASARGAWPFYAEGHRLTANDYAYGMELAVVNRYNDVIEINPWNSPPTGGTVGIQVDSGNGVASAAGAQYTASNALLFVNNAGTGQTNLRGFAHGIVFRNDILDSTLFSPPDAIALAGNTSNHAISWWRNDTTRAWTISSNASAGSNSIVLGDSSVAISATIKPAANDGGALGVSGTGWSDIFVASGAVIDWNAGTATLTEASGSLTYDSATSGAAFTIKNSDAGALGATLIIDANSASPAASDVAASIYFRGRNSTPAATDYAKIQATILDKSAGAEYTEMKFSHLNAGGTFSINFAFGVLYPTVDGQIPLGSVTQNWAGLCIKSGGTINWANSNAVITHSTGLLTLTGAGLKLLVGTNTIAPLTFQAGTNLSSAADGAMEFDGQSLFFSPDASDRRILPSVAICRLHANYTLADSTSLQKIFNATTNGTITLPAGAYIFEAVVAIDAMSGTGGNAALSIVGAGGATVSNLLQVVVGIDGAKATAGAADGASWSVTTDVPAANTSVVTATTATEMAIMWKGSFETTAGTIIPSVDLITGGVTPAVKLGSYFMCWRMGAATDVTQGNWS